MPTDFPNSPASGDVHSVGSRTWEFNGSSWFAVQGSSTIGNIAVEAIADSAANTSNIANSAITTEKIAANAISQTKCASNISLFTITTSANLSTDIPSPFVGQMAYLTDITKIKTWTGSSWITISI